MSRRYTLLQTQQQPASTNQAEDMTKIVILLAVALVGVVVAAPRADPKADPQFFANLFGNFLRGLNNNRNTGTSTTTIQPTSSSFTTPITAPTRRNRVNTTPQYTPPQFTTEESAITTQDEEMSTVQGRMASDDSAIPESTVATVVVSTEVPVTNPAVNEQTVPAEENTTVESSTQA